MIKLYILCFLILAITLNAIRLQQNTKVMHHGEDFDERGRFDERRRFDERGRYDDFRFRRPHRFPPWYGGRYPGYRRDFFPLYPPYVRASGNEEDSQNLTQNRNKENFNVRAEEGANLDNLNRTEDIFAENEDTSSRREDTEDFTRRKGRFDSGNVRAEEGANLDNLNRTEDTFAGNEDTASRREDTEDFTRRKGRFDSGNVRAEEGANLDNLNRTEDTFAEDEDTASRREDTEDFTRRKGSFDSGNVRAEEGANLDNLNRTENLGNNKNFNNLNVRAEDSQPNVKMHIGLVSAVKATQPENRQPEINIQNNENLGKQRGSSADTTESRTFSEGEGLVRESIPASNLTTSNETENFLPTRTERPTSPRADINFNENQLKNTTSQNLN